MNDLKRLKELTDVLNSMETFRIDVFNSIKDAVIITEAGIIIEANKQAHQLYGYDNLIGMEIKHLFLSAGPNVNIKKDGSCFIGHTVTSSFSRNGKVYHVFVVRDITQFHVFLKLIDMGLVSSLLNKLPIGLWLLGPDGKIVFGNEKALQIWGGLGPTSPEEFGSYEAYDENGVRLKAEDWAGYRAAVLGEVVENQEVEIVNLKGERKRIINSAYPLIVGGKIMGTLVINYG